MEQLILYDILKTLDKKQMEHLKQIKATENNLNTIEKNVRLRNFLII